MLIKKLFTKYWHCFNNPHTPSLSIVMPVCFTHAFIVHFIIIFSWGNHRGGKFKFNFDFVYSSSSMICIFSVTMKANYPFVPSSSHISISYGIDTSIGHNACRNTGISLASCVTCLVRLF